MHGEHEQPMDPSTVFSTVEYQLKLVDICWNMEFIKNQVYDNVVVVHRLGGSPKGFKIPPGGKFTNLKHLPGISCFLPKSPPDFHLGGSIGDPCFNLDSVLPANWACVYTHEMCLYNSTEFSFTKADHLNIFPTVLNFEDTRVRILVYYVAAWHSDNVAQCFLHVIYAWLVERKPSIEMVDARCRLIIYYISTFGAQECDTMGAADLIDVKWELRKLQGEG